MAATFPLSIVTPDGAVYDDDASSLVVPGSTGSIGILARHAPMIAELGSGICRFHDAGGSERVYVSGPGVVEVMDGRVIVLADFAESCSSVPDAKKRLAGMHGRRTGS